MSRKLYKAREGKVIDGVCKGIADYFDIDPVIVRLLWIFFGACGGGLLAYVVCMIVVPREPIY